MGRLPSGYDPPWHYPTSDGGIYNIRGHNISKTIQRETTALARVLWNYDTTISGSISLTMVGHLTGAAGRDTTIETTKWVS
jgi:hypothetical protein